MAFSLCAAKHESRSAAMREWRKVSAEKSPRELNILVDSGECFRKVRAELGDAALFERIAGLLKKHFGRYDKSTVNSALRLMKHLQPAVDPVRAATDLTHIRSRVELVADKAPGKWRSTLEMIDGELKILKADYR